MINDIESSEPTDGVAASKIPESVRDLKTWILTQGLQQNAINATNFAAGVEDKDPVYFDSITNEWVASKDMAGSRAFSALADVTNSRAIIFGAVSESGWSWDTSAGNVTIFVDENGDLTATSGATRPVAGVAVSPTVLIVNPIYGSSFSWLIGTIVADVVGGDVVATRAVLSALDTSGFAENTPFYVLGADSPADSKGSWYVWQANPGLTVNTSTVLVSAGGGTERWIAVASPSDVVQSASITGNYTVKPSDSILFCDATGGDVTLQLLAASAGRKLTIIKTDASVNEVIIDANGADTVARNATMELTLRDEKTTLTPFGANYYVT